MSIRFIRSSRLAELEETVNKVLKSEKAKIADIKFSDTFQGGITDPHNYVVMIIYKD